MNAAEANKIATNQIQQKKDREFDHIMRIIRTVAKKGKYEITYYSEITHLVKSELTELGYVVLEQETIPCTKVTIIQWKESDDQKPTKQ